MPSILVVDDSLVERLLVEGLLRKNNEYDVQLAENGKEALAKIKTQPPDLVLSDLFMPEMDGLELVRAVRARHPQIPVVLMTAFGDEATAVAALEAGAASYVPKSRQAECLLKTVDRVVEHAVGGRNRERLSQCLAEYHCRFQIPNDATLIRAFVDQLQNIMSGMGFGDTVERIRIAEALEEALLNAMYHGNLEISGEELAKVRAQLDDRILSRLVEERCATQKIRERTILVVVHISPKEARFVVRDQGRGFNLRFADAGPAGDHFEGGNNRGLMLIRALMDDVSFNEAGNELTLKKYYGVAALAGKPR